MILQLQRGVTAQQSQQVPEIQAVQVIPLTILCQATIQITVALVRIDEEESLRGERGIKVHTSNKRGKSLERRNMTKRTKKAKDKPNTGTCVPSVGPGITVARCALCSRSARRDAKYVNCFTVPISVTNVIKLVLKH